MPGQIEAFVQKFKFSVFWTFKHLPGLVDALSFRRKPSRRMCRGRFYGRFFRGSGDVDGRHHLFSPLFEFNHFRDFGMPELGFCITSSEGKGEIRPDPASAVVGTKFSRRRAPARSLVDADGLSQGSPAPIQ